MALNGIEWENARIFGECQQLRMSRISQNYYGSGQKIISASASASLLHRMPASWHEISQVERWPPLHRFGGGTLMVIR